MTTEHRLLITGSRFIRDRAVVREHLFIKLGEAAAHRKTLVVVHGHNTAQAGADHLADVWATTMEAKGYPVRAERHPAQNHPTEDFGPWPECGPRRNSYMVGLGADEGIAFIDRCTSINCRRPDIHPSHGTSDCLRKAVAAGIPMEEVPLWQTAF